MGKRRKKEQIEEQPPDFRGRNKSSARLASRVSRLAPCTAIPAASRRLDGPIDRRAPAVYTTRGKHAPILSYVRRVSRHWRIRAPLSAIFVYYVVLRVPRGKTQRDVEQRQTRDDPKTIGKIIVERVRFVPAEDAAPVDRVPVACVST